jgi:predicted TIM-barrel fold metal-dependent hydrolase
LELLQQHVLDRGSRAILNCYIGVESFPHPYLAPALASAVNRWLQEQWLDQDGRLRASAVVAPQHTSAAVEEVHRVAADPRFVQIAVPSRSAEGYGQERYWPIWEAAAEHDLVVAIVYGGVTGLPPTPVGWLGSFFEHYATASTGFQAHVLSLTASGIFARVPSLRVVLIESGWTWLPGLLWRFDEHWRSLHREVPWLEVPPSTYIRRHFRFTTEPVDAPPDPRHLREILEQMGGADLLMFGSGYPYDSGEDGSRFLAALTPAETEQVLRANAYAWYRLDGAGSADRIATT